MPRFSCLCSYPVIALAVVLAGCSAADKKSSGGKNNGGGGTAGSGSAGSDTGSFGSAAGINGGLIVVAGTSGSAGDGSATDCQPGQQCAANSPEDGCGTLELKGDVKTTMMPGNVLMVFDRSGSMAMNWNGMPRWSSAGSAMTAALMPLQDQLTIGAIFFPSDDAFVSCNVEPITAVTQVAFMPGAMALAKIQTGGTGMVPMYQPAAVANPLALGQTPTMQGLQAGDAAIAGATLTGTTAVVLITDGEPNCQFDQATAIALVDGWLKKGIKTYVLGLPGADTGMGPTLLNAIATAGGTVMYLKPDDPAALAAKIKEIVESTVSVGIDSCEINFDPAAAVPEKLTLAVTSMGVEQAVPHVYPDGTPAWDITPDGKTASLKGDLCTAAKNGTYESLRFVFGCEDLPPAPPPDPPM